MKGIKKARLCAVATMMMLLLGIFLSPIQTGISFAATEKMGYLGEYKGQELLRGETNVSLDQGDKPYTLKFFYSDAYFTGDSKEYDPHVSSFAMNLCSTSANALNASRMLEDCGFTSVEKNETFNTNKNGPDTVGDIIAHKTIKVDGEDQDVVVVMVRGLEYGLEWSNNFKIGTDGDAVGFSESADKVLSDLNAFSSKIRINLGGAKILVTGYSRGAGIADIVAKKLTDSYKENVFGYCFATPNSVLTSNRSSEYKNIHNITNKNDLITYVFFKDFGFGHYGETKEVTSMADASKVNTQLGKMGCTGKYDDSLEVYSFSILNFALGMSSSAQFAGVDTQVTKKQVEKGDLVEKGKIAGGLLDKIKNSNSLSAQKNMTMTQEEFITQTIKELTSKLITSRDRYAKEIIEEADTTENTIRSMIEVFLLRSSEDTLLEDVMDSFKGAKLGLYDLMEMAGPIINGFDESTFKDDHKRYYDKLWKILGPAMKKNLGEDEYAVTEKVWPSLVYNFCTLTSSAFNDYRLSKKINTLELLLGTWVKNGEKIISNHYTGTYLAFLRASDDFYEREDEKPQKRPEVPGFNHPNPIVLGAGSGSAVSGSANQTGSVVGSGTGLPGLILGSIGGFGLGMGCMYFVSRRKKESQTSE